MVVGVHHCVWQVRGQLVVEVAVQLAVFNNAISLLVHINLIRWISCALSIVATGNAKVLGPYA